MKFRALFIGLLALCIGGILHAQIPPPPAPQFVVFDMEAKNDPHYCYIFNNTTYDVWEIFAIVDYQSSFAGNKVTCFMYDGDIGADLPMVGYYSGNLEESPAANTTGTYVFYSWVPKWTPFGQQIDVGCAGAWCKVYLKNSAGIVSQDTVAFYYND